MGGPGLGAELLLAHTGDLQLTDQQVVRLAAVARRTDARHRAMRTRMDSLMRAEMTARAARPDSQRPRRMGPPPGMPGFAPADMRRMAEQERVDLRDAIAVLTPDQQAQAWEMVARGGAGGRPGRGGPGRGPGAMGAGFRRGARR